MLKKIPQGLYEALPYLYAVTGVAATVVLDAWVGKLSGLMLISAAVVVGHLRFVYRRRRRRPQPRDLSWGHNQRQNPPKDYEAAVKAHKQQRAQAAKPVEDDPDDF